LGFLYACRYNMEIMEVSIYRVGTHMLILHRDCASHLDLALVSGMKILET
jgi:hypothetical protein